MPGHRAFHPGEPQAANAAHDVTEDSLQAMLEVPEGADSPYPPDQGERADHLGREGYPADPDFQLRGGHANPMVDAAMPLFGLVMRLRTLDEAVMSRPWGNNSCWSHEPLLSIFHDETHGGEKVFVLLERIMQAPRDFQDVLLFMYLCFCLGLKGKYALDPKGDEIINALISRMHKVIRELRGPAPEFLGDPYTNVVHRPHRMRRWEWPWWSPLVISAIAMVCAYSYYSYRLDLLTAEVLESLNGILQQ